MLNHIGNNHTGNIRYTPKILVQFQIAIFFFKIGLNSVLYYKKSLKAPSLIIKLPKHINFSLIQKKITLPRF